MNFLVSMPVLALACLVFSSSATAADEACVSSVVGSVSIDKGFRSIYEVTRPCGPISNKPLVVFVNYASEADRDYFSMPSVVQARTTPKSSVAYTYRFMANRLAQLGFPSVRYDPLGVGCSEGQAPSDDAALSPFCIRPSETSALTRADYAEVLGRVLVDPQEQLADYAAARGFIFITHSATTLVVMDLLGGAYRIDSTKAGLVGISPLVTSGAANNAWQSSGVFKERIKGCAASERLNLHFQRCVKKALADAYAVKRIPDASRQAIVSACQRSGNACMEVANAALDEVTETSNRALDDAAKNNEVWSSPGGYAQGMKLHLEFDLSKDLPCKTMAAMRPAVRLLYGSEDIALSAEQQTEQWVACGGSRDEVTVLADVGHTLGSHVHAGPMAEASMQLVIDRVVEVSAQLARRMQSAGSSTN
jgi:hypothetical protein